LLCLLRLASSAAAKPFSYSGAFGLTIGNGILSPRFTAHPCRAWPRSIERDNPGRESAIPPAQGDGFRAKATIPNAKVTETAIFAPDRVRCVRRV